MFIYHIIDNLLLLLLLLGLVWTGELSDIIYIDGCGVIYYIYGIGYYLYNVFFFSNPFLFEF